MAIDVGTVAKGLTPHEQADFADLLMDIQMVFTDKSLFIILYSLAMSLAKQYEDHPRARLCKVLRDLNAATLAIYDNK